MKKLGLALSASVAALSMGCAFFGFSGVPTATPTPAPTATPTPTSTATPDPAASVTPTPAPDAVKGQTLYANCSSCHPALGNLAKKTFDQLKAKKASSPTMGSPKTLADFSDADLNDLAAHLNTL